MSIQAGHSTVEVSRAVSRQTGGSLSHAASQGVPRASRLVVLVARGRVGSLRGGYGRALWAGDREVVAATADRRGSVRQDRRRRRRRRHERGRDRLQGRQALDTQPAKTRGPPPDSVASVSSAR